MRKTASILAPPGIFMDFNSGPKSPFLGVCVLVSSIILSDEALQLGGLFHQGQCPYLSGHEARRVQHF